MTNEGPGTATSTENVGTATSALDEVAHVTIAAGALSIPSSRHLVELEGLNTFSGDTSVDLGPGTYRILDRLGSAGVRVFGSFTVSGTSVSWATGALVVTSSGVAFDLSKLARVTIPLSRLQIGGGPSIVLGRLGNPLPIGGAFTGGDATFYLVDGTYTVGRYPVNGGTWGSFTVSGRSVVSGTAAFTAGTNGALDIQTCALAAVRVQQKGPPTGAPFYLPELTIPPQQASGTATFLLLPGTYRVRTLGGAPTRPDLPFTVPSTPGPIVLGGPLPNWLASVTGSIGTCGPASCTPDLAPPTVTCTPRSVECTGASTPVTGSASCVDSCGSCSTSCESGTYASTRGGSLTCTATDSAGNQSFCYSDVDIYDVTPPSLSVSASPAQLWPPNHKMKKITLTKSASDLCDPNPSVNCWATNSEDPNGETDDIQWIDGELYLRSERAGNGPGRVYTIECIGYDASGNATNATTTVTVPHNQ